MRLLLTTLYFLLYGSSAAAAAFVRTNRLDLLAAAASRRRPQWKSTIPPAFHPADASCSSTTTITTRRNTQLHMVFDFFKQRTDEGMQQLSNLADAAASGNLKGGLQDLASYTAETNAKFANGLSKSRRELLQNMELILTGNPDNILDELEDVLLQADLGTRTSEDVIAEVKSLLQQQNGQRGSLSRDDLKSILRGTLLEALDISSTDAHDDASSSASSMIQFSNTSNLPTVLFVMGANGMGKTTTIGKLAHRLRTEGNQTVLMAACDTFRAGAVEQLQQWADRAEVDCYGPDEKRNSPSAVLYGALDKAVAEKYDTVLVDTSGRLSNNEALTQELAKMKRVIQKRLSVENDQDGKPVLNPTVPHETLLVLDAAQGRMALDSAKVWNEEIGLTGLILTKLDGSARGGSVVSISRELNLPVKLIGVGEDIDDLRDFEPEVFVDGLLGIGKAGGQASAAANEGALLQGRLQEMRKTRDARAKTMSSSSKSPAIATTGPKSSSSGGGSAGELTLQEVPAPPQPAAATGGRRGPSLKPNRKKKKKKGKR